MMDKHLATYRFGSTFQTTAQWSRRRRYHAMKMVSVVCFSRPHLRKMTNSPHLNRHQLHLRWGTTSHPSRSLSHSRRAHWLWPGPVRAGTARRPHPAWYHPTARYAYRLGIAASVISRQLFAPRGRVPTGEHVGWVWWMDWRVRRMGRVEGRSEVMNPVLQLGLSPETLQSFRFKRETDLRQSILM